MPNSSHPFERAVGGKGSKDTRTPDFKARRNCLLWMKSTCCGAGVMPHPTNKEKTICRCCNSDCQTTEK